MIRRKHESGMLMMMTVGAMLLTVLLVACTQSEDAPPVSATVDRLDPAVIEKRRAALDRKNIEPARLTAAEAEAKAGATGAGVPEQIVTDVRTAVARLTGAPPESLEVAKTVAVTWPDGALGCPVPGMVYTQAPVPGYQVVIAHEGRNYDYRVSPTGYMVLCLAETDTPPGGTPTS